MTVYVIGAGMAGLSAAFHAQKAGHRVVVLESANHAGGRCYSYLDKEWNCMLDNGTHLMTGANTALLEILRQCPTETPLQPIGSSLTFYRRNLSCFTIDLNHPLKALIHLPELYKLLAESVLNTPAKSADKALLFKTAKLCFAARDKQIYLAHPSLMQSVVDPVYEYLKDKVEFYFNHPARGFEIDRILSDSADFLLSPGDKIISTVPPKNAEFGTIVNIHYKTDATLPDGLPVVGLVDMLPHWVFCKNGIVSVTISAANNLNTANIAERIWDDLCPLLHSLDSTPPHRVIIDRRATLLQTHKTKRPAVNDDFTMLLAGDGTKTGLPCTIEGAVRSGKTAANLL
ncbi:MAG TPA: hypothetical protein DD624_05470 [Alphaproteobacteria bacterium]|nr:hypothetical protein [Alphaproteobacteria bacterium]